MTVHFLSARQAATRAAQRPSYSRPVLPWVRRRARALQRAFGLGRHEAVVEAGRDYVAFTRRPLGRRLMGSADV